MTFDQLRVEAKRFRSAEPPKAIRGYDEVQTRKLLDDAAKLLERAANEQEGLQRELDRLRSEAGEDAAGKEAIGKALLAATRAGEEMAAEARASAGRITAEAEARAAAILEQAAVAAEERERETLAARSKLDADLAAGRAAVEEKTATLRAGLERERTHVLAEARVQADKIVAAARQEVEGLESYGAQLRSLLADSQRRFVELAESALRQLEGADELKRDSNGGEPPDGRRPSEPDETPSASTLAGD